MARENRDWGYRRIQGALANLGHEVARGTIANILRKHGLEPAPERNAKTTWKEFLSRHRDLMVAADFFTIEAWTRKGLTRFLVLFQQLSCSRIPSYRQHILLVGSFFPALSLTPLRWREFSGKADSTGQSCDRRALRTSPIQEMSRARGPPGEIRLFDFASRRR